MKKMKSIAAIAAILMGTCAGASAQVTVRDDLGRPLFVKKTPLRIVTLAPFLTELVFAAGAGDRVVGVSELSTYPPEVTKLPQIPTGVKFSIEYMAHLKPDLVIAWRDGIRREEIDRITGFGTLVFAASARTLEDVPRLLKLIGALTGNDVTKAVADYEGKLEKLRRENAGKVKLATFLEIWNRPLTTISGTHFMSEALEICRAENVFKDIDGSAPQISYDELYEKNPYVIVGAGSASSNEEFRNNWTVRQALNAVKDDRLVFVDADTFQRPSPRTPDGIEQLCAGLDKVRPKGATQPQQRPAGRPSQYGM
jgi:iron complex transport system substrate-binding protein